MIIRRRTLLAVPATMLLAAASLAAVSVGAPAPGFTAMDSNGATIPSAWTEDLARATPYVREALPAIADGRPIAEAVTGPYGCVIKFKEQA